MTAETPVQDTATMAINATGSQIAVNYTEFPNTTDFMEHLNEFENESFYYYSLEEVNAFHNPFEIVYIIVCILGLTANVLSITATAHIPHGLSAHSKLIISLCVSDSLILVACIAHLFTYLDFSWVYCFDIAKRVLQDTAILATLLNLLAMAADHYLAIIKPMCYVRFMTNFRCNCLILVLWALSLFTGLLEVIVGRLTEMDINSFCLKILADEYDGELVTTIIIFVVLFCVVIFYTRVYFVVKNIIRHDQMLYHDELHNNKATITTMLIIGTFFLFWTPLAIFKIYTSVWAQELYFTKQKELDLTNDFLFLLLLLNSLADPLIYAFRLNEVQKGYKVLLYKFFPNRRFSINEEEFRNQHFSFCSRRRDTIPTIIHDNISMPSPDGGKDFELGKKMEESSFMLSNDNYCEENKKDACTHIFC